MHGSDETDYDVIVVGGGHNGLVSAAYLARSGLRTLLLEARDTLGGPCGTYEFMPGYKAAFTNSPGSFEKKFIEELDLPGFGLEFVQTDPTVLQAFPAGAFVGWRDRDRVAEQLDARAPGEADRYFGLMSDLETLASHLGVSVFEPSPPIAEIARRVPPGMEALFERVFFGSLRQLLDERLKSEEAKALLGMLAINAAANPPSAPGSAIGLMMRPISLASYASLAPDDPRAAPLRGSTGLPVGGMGAIIDAMADSIRAAGGHIETGVPVRQILHRDAAASGVVTADGRTITARNIVSAINPKTTFADLLDDDAVGAQLRSDISALPMRGSAFKLAIALDGLPDYKGLPPGIAPEEAAKVQFRIAPSLDYIERAISDGLAGRLAEAPILWGLIVSETSPDLAPKGRHLLSVNAWHAPYSPKDGRWPDLGETFADRCIDTLSGFMPNLRDRIVDRSWLDPVQIEAELGLVQSNITHGDMLPGTLFGGRPHRDAHDYRTPLAGLYLSGGGTWPGGYVSGLPGYNAARAVIQDNNRT